MCRMRLDKLKCLIATLGRHRTTPTSFTTALCEICDETIVTSNFVKYHGKKFERRSNAEISAERKGGRC